MPSGGESAHLDADLRRDDLGAESADAGDRGQEFDGSAKGGQIGVHLPIDLHDRSVERIDLLQMEAEQEAVMPPDPAV